MYRNTVMVGVYVYEEIGNSVREDVYVCEDILCVWQYIWEDTVPLQDVYTHISV